MTNIKKKKPIERRFELKTLENMSKCADGAIIGSQVLSAFALPILALTYSPNIETGLLSVGAVGAISLVNYKLMKKNNDFKKKIGMLEMPTSKLERVMKNYNINDNCQSKMSSIKSDARMAFTEFAMAGLSAGCIACCALNNIAMSPLATTLFSATSLIMAFDACMNQKKVNTNIKMLGKNDPFRIKFTKKEKTLENEIEF